MNKKYFYTGFGIALSMVGFLGLLYVASPFIYAASSGVVNINAVIRGVTAPLQSNDVATKDFVSAAAEITVTYKGRTSFNTYGEMGGIAGANAKCSATYPGSHMCTVGELLASGATNFGGEGWVACDSVTTNSGGGYSCNTPVASFYGADLNTVTCNQFTSSWGGYCPVANANGNISMAYSHITSPSTARKIHCCQ